jgi:large subunit ribosomal protein L16
MQSPKRTKFRKVHKGSCKRVVANQTNLRFGQYGIQCLEATRFSARRIEMIRRVIRRTFRRTGQVWIRIFPDIPVSAKPAEVRMGKGKGSVSYWAARVKKGQILFEMAGVPIGTAQQAARLASYKLSVPIRFVSRT